jgi:hypothetical protein
VLFDASRDVGASVVMQWPFGYTSALREGIIMSTEAELIKVWSELNQLEHRHRRLERVGMALVALLFVAFGFVAFDLYRARATSGAHEFVLRDTQGNPRARLAVQPVDDGEAAVLELLDEEGRPSTSLEAKDSGTGRLRFYDGDGRVQAQLISDRTGPAFTLYNSAGQPRLWAGILGDSSSLELIDSSGSPRAKLAMNRGKPVFALTDVEGRPQTMLPGTGSTAPSAKQALRTGTRKNSRLNSPHDVEHRYPPGTLGG